MERLSGLHDWHVEAGASMEAFYGWHLPAWYQDPSRELSQVQSSVGISDASYLCKLDLRGAAGEFPRPAQLWKLTAAHALVTSPQSIEFVASSSVTDVTSVYSAILLAGPGARAVLQKLTTLNVSDAAMPEGAARLTRLAHVNATLLRGQGFLILNTRDVAMYVWGALLRAGALPFGMVAQQRWMESSHESV